MKGIKTFKIGDDISIPQLGFGTFLIPNSDCIDVVSNALHFGYRHIDTAEYYKNENGVGLGIAKAIAHGELTRADLFVTTKLWPGNAAWGDTPKTMDTTIASFHESLNRLNLDYIDLYLIHAPFEKEQWLSQWNGLVTLKKQGKVRAIGVSNFNISHLESIKEAGLPLPDVNQVELHPWSQKPKLVKYMRDQHIAIIAYSSLVPLSTWRTGQTSAKTRNMQTESMGSDTIFKKLAQKYQISEAQLLLRWALQHGYAIIPKSTKVERMEQNADVFSFEIEESDMLNLNSLDRGDGVAWESGDPINI